MNVCMSSYHQLKKCNKGGTILKNVSLSNYTTFKIGGRAKIMVTIKTIEGFIRVMDYIQNKKLRYFILGEGSNLLISDKGYDGVVILLKGDLARISETHDGIEVGAGARLTTAYIEARNLGLSGLEVLGTIPGSTGGAIYMNAGAYDTCISDIVSYVIAYVDGKIKYYTLSECEFGYRSSIFQKNNAIILRVGLKLITKDPNDIQAKYLDTLKRKRLSQPLSFPSAGSVFKGIGDLSVSKMLDDMGVKGLREGGAMVSDKHANFIVNDGNAKAKDVYVLIHKVKKMFKDTYGIDLQIEIQFLGDFL